MIMRIYRKTLAGQGGRLLRLHPRQAAARDREGFVLRLALQAPQRPHRPPGERETFRSLNAPMYTRVGFFFALTPPGQGKRRGLFS